MQHDHSSDLAETARHSPAAPVPDELPQVMSGFRKLIGYRMTRWSEGFAEVQLDAGPQHTNVKGTVHGGVLMTLLDGACGRAVAWCAVPGNIRNAVTVNLSVTFIKAPRLVDGESCRLTASARVTGGKRIVAVAGEVGDAEGTVVAQAQGNFQYLRGHERREGLSPDQARAKPEPGS